MESSPMVDGYVRHVATRVAHTMQSINDAMPFALLDALAYAVPVAGLGLLAYGVRSGNWRRTLKMAAVPGLLLCAYASHLALITSRADAYDRFSLSRSEPTLDDHRRAIAFHNEQGMSLERQDDVSSIVIPDEEVCAQVLRTLHLLEQPTVPVACRAKSSRLSRFMRRSDLAIGIFDPFTRDLSVELPLENYWRPLYLAHEIAHSQFFSTEAEADFVAYRALLTAQGPYARPMQQIAHFSRAHAEIIALNERSGENGTWNLPNRPFVDFDDIARSTEGPRQAPRSGTVEQPSSLEQIAKDVHPDVAKYDLGFVALAHAWDRAHSKKSVGETPLSRDP